MNTLDSTPEAKRECDECGKTVAKFSRVLNGHRYCATCYARAFKRRLCPRCGNFARLPKDDLKAVCRKCQRNKPCARCGKTDFKIGKLTQYGPACKACTPYFTDPEPCEICGQPSTKLTCSFRLGFEHRVCPRCSRVDRGTCGACRRHRRLQRAQDGRMLCKPCLEKGEIPCPKCKTPMPAGYGKQCQNCYWSELLGKRTKMDCVAFSSPNYSVIWGNFCQWLGKKTGTHRAALTIHRYLPFFVEIERQWEKIPDYNDLLMHFGTQRLRRVSLPMRWLVESGHIEVRAEAKAINSEKRRIEAIINRVPIDSSEQNILKGYHKSLRDALYNGNTTIRSIRLALSPAVALLVQAKGMGVLPPDQKVLAAFLEKTPGQRAAVSGFVRYLREEFAAELILPPKNDLRIKINRKRRLEAKLLDLIQNGSNNQPYNLQWITTALAYFHDLPTSLVNQVSKEQILLQHDGSYTVACNGENYWIPGTDVRISSKQVDITLTQPAQEGGQHERKGKGWCRL